MEERKGRDYVYGKSPDPVGRSFKVGDSAPDFTVLDNNLNPVRLSSYKGKVCVLSSVPSLDTPVCDLETRRFNQEAAALGPDVVILTVSMDLPFAQKRWCGAAGVDKVVTLSDHRDASFGTCVWGADQRTASAGASVFVVDRDGVIRYVQVVKELTQEPNYDAVLDAVRKLL